MQSFMCFVIVFAMSSATYVTVYTSSAFYIEALTNAEMAASKPGSCFTFGYHLNDSIYMRLYIRHEPPGVTAIDVIYQLGKESVMRSKSIDVKHTGEEYYWVRGVLYYTEVQIILKLYTSNGVSFILVAEGRDVMTSRQKLTEDIYTYNDICSKTLPCVLLVDLQYGHNGPPILKPMTVDETTTPITNLENINNNAVSDLSPSAHEDTKTSTSRSTSNTGTPGITKNKINTSTKKPLTDRESLSNNFKNTVPTLPLHESKEQTTNDTKSSETQPPLPIVFIYVITSIIMMGVITLMIYLCIKKYCHRYSQPAEAIELNTYATANEVVYAELSLMHGDSQPPRREEESPYAKIIGVLKPADGKRKINKS